MGVGRTVVVAVVDIHGSFDTGYFNCDGEVFFLWYLILIYKYQWGGYEGRTTSTVSRSVSLSSCVSLSLCSVAGA